MKISYHASHEQFAPSELLALVRQAEAAGFDAVFCSDHLQPWAPAQGHSGHTWAWLGAALQATSRVTFGTITVPGGWRYPPVVLAQAIATLAEMSPGRLPWLAFGSGEAVNEQPMGAGWPPKGERNVRLKEGVEVIRALLRGERVQHAGALVVDDARLWVRPPQVPLLFGAAVSEATARWLGGWADGLLTLGRDLDRLERNIVAFRDGGGHGKPVHVKVDLSWAPTEAEALAEAHAHWRFNALDATASETLSQPEHFDAASRHLVPDDMRRHVLVAADLPRLADHLAACRQLGVAAVDLHQVNLRQGAFIERVAAEVLPQLGAAG